MSRGLVVQMVTVPAEELVALVKGAVAEALAQRGVTGDSGMLSARAAAKLARRRAQDVLVALEAGSLKGRRRGRRWVVAADEVRRWAAKAKG